MIKRMRYAISHGLQYRKQLYQYLVDPTVSVYSVLALTPDYFQSKKIQYIALDFDGVLANHGETEPLQAVEDWLKKITQIIPESHFALLSNKPFSERLTYFQTHFPQMVIISGVAKKPYPEGLNKLIDYFHCEKSELVLVDDRLLTGMLAVCLAGTQGVYIREAYKNIRKRPLAEGFFMLLRKIERLWIGWLVR